MFRIATLNCNGLRAAAKKGLAAWMDETGADVLCLQEIKAQEVDIPAPLRNPAAGHAYFYPAQKKGYSGTAMYTKTPPRQVQLGFGVAEFDHEGRYLEAQFDGATVISVYFPSGSSGPERQAAKFRFLDAFFPHLNALRARGQEVIVCGDVNIAHQAIDLKNWKGNQKNSGFLPEERAWLTRLFDEQDWVDVFRTLDPRPEQYTWWSQRGQAYAKNVGWRIDYQIATPGIAAQAQRAHIDRQARFSDHAPLIVDYEGAL